MLFKTWTMIFFSSVSHILYFCISLVQLYRSSPIRYLCRATYSASSCHYTIKTNWWDLLVANQWLQSKHQSGNESATAYLRRWWLKCTEMQSNSGLVFHLRGTDTAVQNMFATLFPLHNRYEDAFMYTYITIYCLINRWNTVFFVDFPRKHFPFLQTTTRRILT